MQQAFVAVQQALASFLVAALAQPLHTSADVLEEAQENLFFIELAESELAACRAPLIEEWLENVLADKRQQLQQRGDHYAMQFYCWHDALAMQLRFSIVSAAATLPFSCSFRFVELSVVVQEYLKQEYLLFDENLLELHSAAVQLAAEKAAVEAFVLPVWRTIIS